MKITLRIFLILLLPLPGIFSCGSGNDPGKKLPNIIILYADDLGYGDLSCYGATGISTPNIDRIAKEGLRFTNGYATSATCTPSRYGLLTGIYPWRNKEAKVLPGNAPLLIDPSKPTLPSTLRKAGYITGVTGKWHLGLGGENMDWNKKISPGPNDVGFDYAFIMASTNDRSPTVCIENDHVYRLSANDPLEVSYEKNFPGEPTGKDNPEMLKMFPSHGHDMSINDSISRIGFMKGGKSARWTDEYMADTILQHALDFIIENKDKPFFLYYAFHQVHVPRVPNPRFVESSGMGPRGDVLMEMDYDVGRILKLLDSLKLENNTIVVFSSDNGPVLDDGYKDQAVERAGNHKPSDGLRGGKYSLFDAGTHVPFMIRWTGRISPGTSDAIVCQIDLAASFAALTNQENVFPDSKNLLTALLGTSSEGRHDMVLEAMRETCLVKDNWVMIPPHNGPAVMKNVNIETGYFPEYQLYDLSLDRGQQQNLAAENPGKLDEMKVQYEKIVSQNK